VNCFHSFFFLQKEAARYIRIKKTDTSFLQNVIVNMEYIYVEFVVSFMGTLA
jgi:hypothetical protein